MSKSSYPLKLPASVKKAAAELAASDGVSLNQFIAVAVPARMVVHSCVGRIRPTPSGHYQHHRARRAPHWIHQFADGGQCWWATARRILAGSSRSCCVT